jgi:isopenicillin-N epimerase
MMKDQFLLDPEFTYLNHGSFGACPRPVFEDYQSWQRRLERQPVELLGRQGDDLMAESRTALAEYLGCQRDDVIYFPNPTTAVNMIARSLKLSPGDEILTSNHEYGAMDRTWRFIARRTGADYRSVAIPLPVTTHDDFVEQFWSHVSPGTRLIFLSHITSPTALRFPVEEICRRARAAGILTLIDGAHAPGQIPLDLEALGADFYTGALHKWLCTPKGVAFLHARRSAQELLEPLVVSWGWEAEEPGPSRYVDHHQWQGTRDISAFLSVPAAIRFQHEHDWEKVRTRGHQLAVETRRRLLEIFGGEPICPEGPEWLGQMSAVRLPEMDWQGLQQRLVEEHKIEVFLWPWHQETMMRVSFQAYNDQTDADRLIEALETEIND